MNKTLKLLALVLALLIPVSCTVRPKASIDPHEGMIQVHDGNSMIWIPLAENLKLNSLAAEDFTTENGISTYKGDYRHGIDVSEHQLEIDWQAVAQSGLADFVFIRAAYRGYTEGGVYEDARFRENMAGAAQYGIDTGVYFFSQAITPREAVEEAEFLLELIKDYDISLPIVYDWETVNNPGARTAGLDADTLTKCAIAFCQRIKEAGYEPMVHLYKYLAYHNYDLDRLADYPLWVANPGAYPDFCYEHSWWQYSYEGKVPGIEVETDLNLYFPALVQTETE